VTTVVIGALVPVMLAATPALASYKPDDGEHHGPALGAGMTILLFVVIPLGAFLVIAGLAVLPSALSRPRYRPGTSWDHDPLWIGGPAQTDAGSEPGSTARGGASAEW
jgi:hypothetical protein